MIWYGMEVAWCGGPVYGMIMHSMVVVSCKLYDMRRGKPVWYGSVWYGVIRLSMVVRGYGSVRNGVVVACMVY